MSAMRLIRICSALTCMGYASAFAPTGTLHGRAVVATKMTTTPTDHDHELLPPSSSSSRREALVATAFATVAALAPRAEARLEPVDRPDLLPTEKNQPVIQIEKFLTNGQVKRISEQLTRLEKDTGFRVRLLCQAYPKTPGLAIRDYWSLGKEDQQDDKYIVLIVDQFGGKGNALNFNVGEGVKFALPNVFWTRLSGKYGTVFYVRENGIDVAIENALDSVTTCLRSEDQFCVNVPDLGAKGF